MGTFPRIVAPVQAGTQKCLLSWTALCYLKPLDSRLRRDDDGGVPSRSSRVL